jgi:hypothetical protein
VTRFDSPFARIARAVPIGNWKRGSCRALQYRCSVHVPPASTERFLHVGDGIDFVNSAKIAGAIRNVKRR